MLVITPSRHVIVHPEDSAKSVPVLLINKIYSTYSKVLVFETVDCFSLKIYWKNKLGPLTKKQDVRALSGCLA